MIFWLEMSAVAVCAITGTLETGRRQMDLFGAAVVAFVAALGGGTLRDLLLGRLPVFWVIAPANICVVILSVLATFITARRFRLSTSAFLIPDALGLALFTMLGTEKALACHVGFMIAIVMGVITGVFGGILRDVLCNEAPVVFRSELYATAALSGALPFSVLNQAGTPNSLAFPLGIVVIFAIRMVALQWRITLPKLSPPR